MMWRHLIDQKGSMHASRTIFGQVLKPTLSIGYLYAVSLAQVLARIPSTETLSRTTAAAGMADGKPGAAAAYAARLAAYRKPSEAEEAAAIAAKRASASGSSDSSGSRSGSTVPTLTLESRPLDSMGLYHFTPEDYADGIGR